MFTFVLMFASVTVSLSFSQNLLDAMLKSTRQSGERFIPLCPETLVLKASWLLRPPFAMTTTSSERGEQIHGIFYDILDLALTKCCDGTFSNSKTSIKPSFNYTTQAAANTAVLHADILKGDADLILPIQSDDKDVYKGFLPYINIVDSPGVVLIQRTDSIHRWSSKNILLLNAVSSCWPIFVLTLLLSFVAGMIVWEMVSC